YRTIGPGATDVPAGSQRQFAPLSENERHSCALASVIETSDVRPGAGAAGLSVAALRLSSCGRASGWWAVSIAAGVAIGATDDVARDDHSLMRRSATVARSTMIVAFASERNGGRESEGKRGEEADIGGP